MAIRITLLLLLVFVHHSAKAVDLDSRIESVIVYPSGAIITRVATTDLAAGSNDIQFVDLVDAIDQEYLQVEVASSGVRIGQIRLTTEQQRDAVDTEIAAVVTEIELMNTRIQAVDDSISAAQLRLKFLDGLAQGYAKEAWIEDNRSSSSVDSLRAALDLLQSGAEDASALIRGKNSEKTELQKDLSVLIRTLAELRGGGLQSATAELTVSADRATTTEIRIRYFQEDAYWEPLYESRLDSDSGALELTLQAKVEQTTDEDWNNVSLTLSTSEPSGELIAPEVYSEFLNLIEPQPARQRMAQSVAVAAFESDQIEEITVSGARIADVGNFAVNYEIPGRSSVSNDSEEPVSLDLEQFQFDTELVTQVVPRESTQAFLAARFIYDQSVPLYGSEMLVFVDGVFAGFSEMPTALPQAEVLLPMGQDRRVDVKSESQGGEGGRSGIIGRRQNEVTDYLFEITNRRGTPSFIEVLDRIPVARNREIDVEVPRTATPPTETDIDDQPGLVMWRNTLAPGEAWRIQHQYTVSYPEKYRLVRE